MRPSGNTPDGSRGIVKIQPKQHVPNRIVMVLIGLVHCSRRVPVARHLQPNGERSWLSRIDKRGQAGSQKEDFGLIGVVSDLAISMRMMRI
jgi:hypothetical protein